MFWRYGQFSDEKESTRIRTRRRNDCNDDLVLIILFDNVQDQMPGDIIHEHAEALARSARTLARLPQYAMKATHMVGRETRDPS